MTKFSDHKARRGFTLIELLIVIGILGALAALVLPSMLADRTAMLEKVCDYNNAGTMRVLKQYQQFTGKLPSGLHTGLQDPASHTPMDGMPAAQVPNVTDAGSSYELTDADAQALKNVGITTVAYDTGLNTPAVVAGLNVMQCTPAWKDDGNAEYQFAGKTITDLNTGGARVLVFYVTPTVDWSGTGTGDWGEGNVKVSLDVAGQCPVPVDEDGVPDFRYYMAYVAVYAEGFGISAAATGDATVPSFGASDEFANEQDAKQAAEDIVDEVANNLTWVGADWADGSAEGTQTRTANYHNDLNDDGVVDTGEDTGTIVFTITDRTVDGYAELVGTSCPECGVLNP